jgi:hypothetical protein
MAQTSRGENIMPIFYLPSQLDTVDEDTEEVFLGKEIFYIINITRSNKSQ